MLIRRSSAAVFAMLRSTMLASFAAWIADAKPTRAEIDAEIASTVSALRQIADLN